jgi:endonuclease/exonuclease/phosphatase family metal-dependent hydrolase
MPRIAQLVALGALFALFSGSLLAQATTATAQDSRAQTLRVATWNLLNLFDDADEPDKPDEGTDPKSWVEMRELARFIDEIDADVIGVQEVENRRILGRLNQMLKKPYGYVELIEGNDARGIDVGIMSRVPVTRVASHRLMELKDEQCFARDFPLFRIEPAKGMAIELGVMHLKSKRGKKAASDAWRRAEAQGVSDILKRQRKLEPDVPVMIMGDFNDNRSAQTLEPLFSWLDDPTKALVSDKDRFTFVHRGEPEQIDFLLTKGIAAKKAWIWHRPDNPSDHRPVIVEFPLGRKIERAVLPAGQGEAEPKRPQINARDLAAFKHHFLKEVTAKGRVTKVFRPKSGGALLNFPEDFRTAITVYIPREATKRFGKLDQLVGKNVLISGPVGEHRDTYQIRMTRPVQLVIAER